LSIDDDDDDDDDGKIRNGYCKTSFPGSRILEEDDDVVRGVPGTNDEKDNIIGMK
jgi:hypothetical protein